MPIFSITLLWLEVVFSTNKISTPPGLEPAATNCTQEPSELAGEPAATLVPRELAVAAPAVYWFPPSLRIGQSAAETGKARRAASVRAAKHFIIFFIPSPLSRDQ
jgi:hypothetical protein